LAVGQVARKGLGVSGWFKQSLHFTERSMCWEVRGWVQRGSRLWQGGELLSIKDRSPELCGPHCWDLRVRVKTILWAVFLTPPSLLLLPLFSHFLFAKVITPPAVFVTAADHRQRKADLCDPCGPITGLHYRGEGSSS
jgi:hypothetical protein